jgi:hypothetical protein
MLEDTLGYVLKHEHCYLWISSKPTIELKNCVDFFLGQFPCLRVMLNTVSYKIFTKAFNVHEKKRLELAKE